MILSPSIPEHLLKEFLEEKYDQYNRPAFITSDPIQIPHRFTLSEDIEIAAFLTATIAWGQRKAIISNATRLMSLMGNNPYDFVMNASTNQLTRTETFVHRTFQGVDCLFFIKSLRNIYRQHQGLKEVFQRSFRGQDDMEFALAEFRKVFFEIDCHPRTFKHISDVSRGSSGKRLNMFLRWMVRNDKRGVDFGLWKDIPASSLHLPLDLHTGNVARKLLLLTRKQDDWKAVSEVTLRLRTFDPIDPIKYDFALFGLGVFEGFK